MEVEMPDELESLTEEQLRWVMALKVLEQSAYTYVTIETDSDKLRQLRDIIDTAMEGLDAGS
jgi:hypothetical protein